MHYEELETINLRPKPFEFYTASDLWTDEYTSKQMLAFHLNESVDISSRNAQFIQESVAWIISRFNLSSDTSVADFGCGPGLYAKPLAEHQVKVTGIDFSKRSIQHAISAAERAELPINYIHCNYLEFETEERFDVIIMIMCDFCALSPAQREVMLKKFCALLKPKGRVLLDVYSLAGYVQREETASYQLNQMNGFWSPNRYYGFHNTFKYEDEKVILDKYTIVECNRSRTVYNWLQYFSTEALKTEFANAGLRVTDIYSDVAGTSFNPQATEFAVVAERHEKI